MSSFPPTAGGSIVVSTARWPLIHVRFIGHSDEATFDTYLEDLTRAITSRQGPRAILVDATQCGYVSSYARKRQAEWMRTHEANTRRETIGIAFALEAPLVRGALTAVLWLEPLNCPYAVVRDEATAMTRCRAWLEARGLTIPKRVPQPVPLIRAAFDPVLPRSHSLCPAATAQGGCSH